MEIKIIYGDITEQETDAIVNSANPTLLGGGGIDGQIHLKAGDELYRECLNLRKTEYINGLEEGNAIITKGYNLKSKYIIHCHGPVCHKYSNDIRKNILENCYINCLELADENNLTSISFPLISNGIFSCKVEETSIIVLNTIKNYFFENNSSINLLNIVIYEDKEFGFKDKKNFEIYLENYKKIFN